MRIKLSTLSFLCLFLPVTVIGAGNETIESYAEAKKLFDTVHHDHRTTIYCGFPYAEDRSIELPEGFIIASFPSRARRMEREHVVPAQNFGRAFVEWREGAPECRDGDGIPFKGRKCAGIVSRQFRRMEADLHNLFPSVGCVNAKRSNFNFTELPSSAETPFGPTCPIKFLERRVEPPDTAKGVVARAYLYMDWAYDEYQMSKQQRRVMEAWDAAHPPDGWECERNRRIKRLQGNENPFITSKCHPWPNIKY